LQKGHGPFRGCRGGLVVRKASHSGAVATAQFHPHLVLSLAEMHIGFLEKCNGRDSQRASTISWAWTAGSLQLCVRHLPRCVGGGLLRGQSPAIGVHCARWRSHSCREWNRRSAIRRDLIPSRLQKDRKEKTSCAGDGRTLHVVR
jgi:hypothetical protein